MGWLIITFCGFLLGLLAAWHEGVDGGWRDPNRYLNGSTLGSTLVVSIFSLIIGGIISLTDSGISHSDDHAIAMGCTAHKVVYPIISSTREKNTSGNFVLGTGGINSVDRYYVYVSYDNGMKLKTFNTRNTYIVEGTHEPYYKRTDYYCERTFRNWFWFGTAPHRPNKGDFGQLYVPENTILRRFKL